MIILQFISYEIIFIVKTISVVDPDGFHGFHGNPFSDGLHGLSLHMNNFAFQLGTFSLD